MDKKRDRIQIITDVLRAIQMKGEAKPTHVLYKANLSHDVLKQHLKDLISKGLVIEIAKGTRRVYSLTDRGHKYLEEFAVVSKFLDSYGLLD